MVSLEFKLSGVIETGEGKDWTRPVSKLIVLSEHWLFTAPSLLAMLSASLLFTGWLVSLAMKSDDVASGVAVIAAIVEAATTGVQITRGLSSSSSSLMSSNDESVSFAKWVWCAVVPAQALPFKAVALKQVKVGLLELKQLNEVSVPAASTAAEDEDVSVDVEDAEADEVDFVSGLTPGDM